MDVKKRQKSGTNRRRQGSFYEEWAAEYLKNLGYQILDRNYHAGHYGEIDLVAYDPQEKTIVFAEVKYRKNSDSGHPAEAVTWKKQQTIRFCANNYLLKEQERLWDIPGRKHIRFDVIAILGTIGIEHYKNAF